MSNVGKTYWSKKLDAVGFRRFGCDDMIEEKLEKELKNAGFNGISDVAKWLGQPFEPQHKKNSKKYLEIERSVMCKIIDRLRYHVTYHDNIIVDTTGSVIYHDEKILSQLRNLTKIVCLETTKEVHQQMYKLYLKEPKPVIWGESFRKQNGESDIDALRICYPKLLQYRASRYHNWADIMVDSATVRAAHFDTRQFLQLLSR